MDHEFPAPITHAQRSGHERCALVHSVQLGDKEEHLLACVMGHGAAYGHVPAGRAQHVCHRFATTALVALLMLVGNYTPNYILGANVVQGPGFGGTVAGQ